MLYSISSFWFAYCLIFINLLMPTQSQSQYFIKMDHNFLAQLNRILGYDSYLHIPKFQGHFGHAFLFTNRDHIIIAPMTNDYKLCSLLNAIHFNGPFVKNFKIQHIRDNFSIQIDDLTKIPAIEQLLQNYEKVTFNNLKRMSPQYVQETLTNARNCEKILSKNGDLNLTLIGRSIDNAERQYLFQGSLIKAEHPPLATRFDIQDHHFIVSYYTQKIDAHINKRPDDLNVIRSFHDALYIRLQKAVQTQCVSYPTGVAHSVNEDIKSAWNLQQISSLKLVKIIDKIK